MIGWGRVKARLTPPAQTQKKAQDAREKRSNQLLHGTGICMDRIGGFEPHPAITQVIPHSGCG